MYKFSNVLELFYINLGAMNVISFTMILGSHIIKCISKSILKTNFWKTVVPDFEMADGVRRAASRSGA